MEVRTKMTKTDIKLNAVLNSVHSNNSNLVEIVFDDPTEFDTTRNDITKPAECTTVGWIKSFDITSVKITWLKEIDDSTSSSSSDYDSSSSDSESESGDPQTRTTPPAPTNEQQQLQHQTQPR